ncbi:hypothetical protein ABN028_27635 [Actinopolymorpha sp. B17G11]|uniref:hypothetical protein n=1 Tax=Actinopolymorpha sp. B17G11 TaxID=3160861 RepID=UPI0032E45C8E
MFSIRAGLWGLAVAGLVAATAPAATASSAALSEAAGAPRVWEVEPSSVTEVGYVLKKGQTVTVETTGLSSGADPVLHLLDRNGRQVAMDDDSGPGQAARLTYTAPLRAPYYVVLRAASSATAGSATLVTTRGKFRSERPVTFSRWSPTYLASLRGGEKITSVPLPGVKSTAHRLYLLGRDGRTIERRDVGAAGAELVLDAPLGSRSVVLASASTTSTTTERARLVRNDAALYAADADGDGLGRELEAALGTCARRTDTVPGVDCASVADLRDSDGDGISDGLETVGGTVTRDGVSERLLLPRWGANPRHKDLFVEVDFMRRTKQENDDDTELRMLASVARKFADQYGDALTTSPSARAAHAASLRNPDGKTGIAVHLDTGQEPETADDATIYGDWGGYSAVDAIQVDGSYVGVTASNAWKTAMKPTRRGIFRYALGYGTGGGQTGFGLTASYNFNSSFVAPHETGHSLGLGHGGLLGAEPDVNCKPNYPSLMNYAFDSGEAGFADGSTTDGPALNNAALKESGVAKGASAGFFDRLESVYGYDVDRAGGHVDWNRDGEFAPVGTTVRAYANLALGGGGCEFTRWNKVRIPYTYTYLPPALARLDGKLQMIYPWGGDLKYADSDSTWNCPKPTPGDCAGGTWSRGKPLALPTDAAAADAVTVRTAGKEEMLIVANGLDGSLWQRSLIAENGSIRRTPWQKLAGSASRGGPSLALGSGGTVYLAYTDPGGEYRVQRRTRHGEWKVPQPFVAANGDTLARPADSRFSPAVVEATLAGKRRIYALLADESDRLDLWRLDPLRAAGRTPTCSTRIRVR